MSIKISLSKNIKKYRKQFGWTQQELAIKSGLPFSVVTKIEQGFTTRPEIQTVVKIAKALRISIDQLIN